VPGKRPRKNRPPFGALSLAQGGRRVRYDRALLIPEVFFVESAFHAHVLGDRPFPYYIDFFCFHIRNFVIPILQSPYRSAHTCKNQTVPYGRLFWGGDPPGTSCQATIALSLWDKSHSPMGRFIELALMGFQQRPKPRCALKGRQIDWFKNVQMGCNRLRFSANVTTDTSRF
jgi:hypothetical protein